MALVPLSYNVRSLLVRRSATLLTVLGIAATVAVVSGVIALQQGFATLFTANGRPDVWVFLRQGANSEGESLFTKERADVLMKTAPEIETDASGQPLAAREVFLAVLRDKIEGGKTNVPVRGVQPMSLTLAEGRLRIVEGRAMQQGADEVIVGAKLTNRIRDCRVGDVLVFNTTPFRVVGEFEYDGPYASEIWGDLDRVSEALDRPVMNRIIARLKPGVDADAFKARMDADVQTPCKAQTEPEYLTNQTGMLSFQLVALGTLLALIMGIAAIFTSTNTMLAALAARTHEIGILLAVGFRPFSIFLSFLFEATLLGLLGGALGALFTLPLNGIETGTSNFDTFTEVAFAFRVTPPVLITAVLFSLVLGVAGGAWPAWRAARLSPTAALRRQ